MSPAPGRKALVLFAVDRQLARLSLPLDQCDGRLQPDLHAQVPQLLCEQVGEILEAALEGAQAGGAAI